MLKSFSRSHLTMSALALSLALSAAPVVLAQEAAEGTATVQTSAACKKFYSNTVDATQNILHETKGSMADKQAKLGEIFDKSVDSAWIGRFVIGRFWKEASPEQQKEYLDLYSKYLRKVYVSKFNGEDLTDFNVKLVSITPLRSGDYDTRTVITRPDAADVHVNYTLNDSGGKCQVRDIIVENVSLLTSQRSEFQTLAGRSGIDGVMSALKSKIGQPQVAQADH